MTKVDPSSSLQCAVSVDARTLRCPLPLLRAKQAMRDLAVGERIIVRATDAGSVRDFHAFVQLAQHRLIEFIDAGDEYIYVIEKGGSA
ncbi:sulfurtransferase TusA family protein [Gilvimarinus polysaccharolyticus]|uniref:sulfurtransferase TusA family protein n=1 Tax=Gilvimarinus polysaccharolyticus TaxID=863921 RepID=UPI0006739A14|nr:sulfurtransferase TusA family protein [Gilvimarinus polysaccharolyticus]